MMDVILYTRNGCPVCEEADQLLKRHGLTARQVDIDAEPDLQTKYDCCVPVVSIDGTVRFRGRVNEVLLKRLLASKNGGPAKPCRPANDAATDQA